MATLSENLQTAASRLISEYGNKITLIDKSDEGWYDPQSGTRHQTTLSYTKKGYVKNITSEDIKIGKIDDNMIGNISSVVTLAYDSDLERINNQWTANDLTIYKIVKVSSQDNYITVKLFIG